MSRGPAARKSGTSKPPRAAGRRTGCPPPAAGPGSSPPRPGGGRRRRAPAAPRRSPGRTLRARIGGSVVARQLAVPGACTSGRPQASQKRSSAACSRLAHRAHERRSLGHLELDLLDLVADDRPQAQIVLGALDADDQIQGARERGRVGVAEPGEVDVGLRRDRVRAGVRVVDRAEIQPAVLDRRPAACTARSGPSRSSRRCWPRCARGGRPPPRRRARRSARSTPSAPRRGRARRCRRGAVGRSSGLLGLSVVFVVVGARCIPLSESLNSRMPLPSDRPTSGSFFGPITIRAMMSTRISSPGPMLPRNGIGYLGYLSQLGAQHEKVLGV